MGLMSEPVGAAPGSGGEPGTETCPDHPKKPVVGPCGGCGKVLCYDCAVHAPGEGISVVRERGGRCVDCTRAAEVPRVRNLPRALLAGVGAAIVGAGVWGGLVALTDREVGYFAWGVGLLVGVAVMLAAGGSRGRPFQIVGASCGLLGIALGKYFMCVIAFYSATSEQGLDTSSVSIFGPIMFQMFLELLPNIVSGFDLLWIFLAVTTAWQIPGSSLRGGGLRLGGGDPEEAAAREQRSRARHKQLARALGKPEPPDGDAPGAPGGEKPRPGPGQA